MARTGPGKASSFLSAHGASRASLSAVLGTADLAEKVWQLADADLDAALAGAMRSLEGGKVALAR